MGKRHRAPGRDRGGRWKLSVRKVTHQLQGCPSAWRLPWHGEGARDSQRRQLAAPGFPMALFWAGRHRLSPEAGDCLRQLPARLRAGAGLGGFACWGVWAGRWKGGTRSGPWDACVPIPGGFVPLPHASILQGTARDAGAPQAEVGDLKRAVGSRSDVCTVPVAWGAAIAASVR